MNQKMLPKSYKKEKNKLSRCGPVFSVNVRVDKLGKSSMYVSLIQFIPEGYQASILISSNPRLFNSLDMVVDGIYTILVTPQPGMDKDNKNPVVKYGLRDVLEGHNRQELLDSGRYIEREDSVETMETDELTVDDYEE